VIRERRYRSINKARAMNEVEATGPRGDKKDGAPIAFFRAFSQSSLSFPPNIIPHFFPS
jgi:hypothetical protein